MTKLYNFDVLIVYSQRLATSAYEKENNNTTPFPKGSRNESYNEVYSYFLESCQKIGLKAALTTSADIVGPGFCRSFWEFNNDQWHKINSPCYSSFIFDKFSPTTATLKTNRQLLFSLSQIKPFNDPGLFNLFFDKQKTSNSFAQYAIPTVSLESNNLLSIQTALSALAKLIDRHPNSQDFSSDIIVKDRYGAGGRHVYKFDSKKLPKILSVITKNNHRSFVIQPFVNFDHGFNHDNNSAATDIRLVYLNGEIVQTYIRVAKSGEFRCNEHRGGTLTYIPLSAIPKIVLKMSNLIAKDLNNKRSLYALDFVISDNGNAYLLEGNTSPGLDWNLTLKHNEIEAKKLIRLVVQQLLIWATPPVITGPNSKKPYPSYSQTPFLVDTKTTEAIS